MMIEIQLLLCGRKPKFVSANSAPACSGMHVLSRPANFRIAAARETLHPLNAFLTNEEHRLTDISDAFHNTDTDTSPH